MKKYSKRFKIIVSVLLIVVVVSSLALPVLADSNIISGGLSKVGSVLRSNEPSKKVEREEEKPQTLTQDITTPKETDNQVEAIKAKAAENRKHRLKQQDEFNYAQKDVEELLLSGATLEDIYRSDEIGNQLLVNPKELIKTKRAGKENWDDIEKDVTEQKQKQLKTLIKKHANLEKKFAGKTISDAEKLEILQQVETNPDLVSDDIIATFKEEGRSGLQKLHDKNSKGKGGK
ncbi:hypothetical protein GCM10008018_13880 [Paenibacillus marchantiophytorum]|uniref:Uncharacterized protein n=1 Tax=Paenibacillus marchantiophytorum TaxID=1619310 RepID=A0ABQ2BRG2_9BACL|nr:hypothetical protein [Paenibacillus marchantiophytorum]GGI45789.1 hypothetical protein GCM10008018_13880 [Paenibacillus marchantiophytorum]